MNKADEQYHDVLREVIKQPLRGDRTNTGTYSKFGMQMRFENIATEFPLITTKKIHFRSIVHELVWMLHGDTNIKYLVDNNVNIWNDWPLKYYNAEMLKNKQDRQMSREEFIEAIKTNPEFAAKWGNCGPIYGKQWINWDTAWDGGSSIDQISVVVDQLLNEPESRRMIVNAWNPADIEEMSFSGLPPCHTMFQFYTRPIPIQTMVDNAPELYGEFVGSPKDEKTIREIIASKGHPSRYLDCQLYQRSGDLFIGIPFNIAQYALLTTMMAKCVNMIPGTFVHTIGDVHIYSNHVEQVQEQLSRPYKYPSPTVELLLEEGVEYTHPGMFEADQVVLHNYQSYGAIKAPIAV